MLAKLNGGAAMVYSSHSRTTAKETLLEDSKGRRARLLREKMALCLPRQYPNISNKTLSARASLTSCSSRGHGKYYHGLLGHAEAATKLEKTVRRHFSHPNIGIEAKRLIDACDICKRMKHSRLNYGELPIREISHVLPWQQVHVDMIGPWKLKVNKTTNVEIKALTCIEPVLNLLEIFRCNDKKGNMVARAFENGYLSRYPRPLECVHDNGPEFICRE